MESDDIWYCFCYAVGGLFTLATLIVYSIVPEVKNLRGSLLRQYLASYLGYCATWLLVPSLLFDGPYSENSVLNLVLGSSLAYSGVAAMLWLNVISFDIWQTFRNQLPSRDLNTRVCENGKLVRYSIYAWGSPVVFIVSLLLSHFNNEPFRFVKYGGNTHLWVVWLPMCFGVAISNTCFYVLTALTIRNSRKETAYLSDGVSRHHNGNEQWFNLYSKLFVIMGVRIIFWVMKYFYQATWRFWILYSIVELLDCILIFLMFVWKDDIKRSLRHQFFEMMRKVGSIFRRHSTPSIRSDIVNS